MLADIAALQHMYGANFNTRSTDTVYQWSTRGELIINGDAQGIPSRETTYMTIWDGGGTDTYDFSNWTDTVHVDLRPGEFSTPGFREFVDDDGVVHFSSPMQPLLGHIVTEVVNRPDIREDIYGKGSIANAFLFNGDTRSLIENAIGGSGDDLMIGNQANNTLEGGAGDDTLFYTGGVDTFSGGTMATGGGGFTRSGGGGGGALGFSFGVSTVA
jgi:serralysin